MDYFFYNSMTLAYAFAIWFMSGLGVSLLLFPRYKYRDAFLLAPVIGVSLIALIGLFQITVLLVPITPKINIGFLVTLSLIVCFWVKRKDFQKACVKFRYYWLMVLLPALILLFIFSWIFHNGGFHLIVGGSDQLQYAENARHITEEMHTGSLHDIPVPRQNYYVYEGITRTLPYLKSYRRGAEVVLATTTAVTQHSYPDTFSIVIFCSLATLSLVLTFIVKNFFRFTLFSCLVTQILFLSSFYLLVLQIQGSLALTLSIAPELAALSLFTYIIRQFSWKWLFLQVILLGGYFAVYSEPALISMLIPCLALIGLEWWRSKQRGFIALKRITLIYLIISVIVPFSIYSIIKVTSGNLVVIYYQLLTSLTQTPILKLTDSNISMWNPISVILGIVSYYDSSAFNYHIASFLAQMPRIIEVIFLMLCVFATLGFMRIRNLISFLFIIILIMWTFCSLIIFNSQDPLRLVRCVQYVMPFILLGLMILSVGSLRLAGSRQYWPIVTWTGRVLLISFIFINVSSNARTISYITSHDMSNDLILSHYSERYPMWKTLQNELHISAIHNAPVLIAGFKETIKPFIISIAIRDQPHMLGNSISEFWQIYRIFNDPLDISILCFNSSSLNPVNHLFVNYPNQILLKKFCTSYSDVELKKIIFANSPAMLLNDSSNTTKDFLDQLRNLKPKGMSPLAITFPFKSFNTKISKHAFQIIQANRSQSWIALEPQLLILSEQAVVPVGHGYPEEWGDTKDVYAPRVKRFLNMCDVVYRRDYVVTPSKDIVSSLTHDVLGPYRKILKSGNILVSDPIDSNHLLSLTYEGNSNDIALKIGNRLIDGKILSESKQIKIEANVSPEEIHNLELVVKKPVKLRSMEWISSVV